MPRKRRILGDFRFICQSDQTLNDSRNPAHILEAHFLPRRKYESVTLENKAGFVS